jgi:hypothetical protein
MVWSKLIKKYRLDNINNVFVFTKQYQQVYYTYTHSFTNYSNRVYWLFVVKTKPKSHFKVVKDGNDKVTMRDDVFQLDGLIDPYRVALSIELGENSNFHIAKHTYIDVGMIY